MTQSSGFFTPRSGHHRFASTPSHPHPGLRTLPVPQQPGLRLHRSFCRRAYDSGEHSGLRERPPRLLLDECGRQILQTVFNHLEPQDPQDALQAYATRPPGLRPQGTPEKPQPGRHRLPCSAPSNSSVVCTNRCRRPAMMTNRPLHGPLELALGIVANNATLAWPSRSRQADRATDTEELRTLLQRDHHVHWSVTVLRQVTAAVNAGIAPSA